MKQCSKEKVNKIFEIGEKIGELEKGYKIAEFTKTKTIKELIKKYSSNIQKDLEMVDIQTVKKVS